MNALVLGAGFTGSRAAALLAPAAVRTVATVRSPASAERSMIQGVELLVLDADEPASVASLRRRLDETGEGWRALVAFAPARRADGSERVGSLLGALRARLDRVVLISSTTVYGAAARVDEATAAASDGERERLYLAAERGVLEGPWSGLVLRAAAIYGPGRGILAEGGPRFAPGRSADAVISRIHADDLAALAVAALAGDLRGAFPVADDEPASARTVLAALAGEPAPSAPDAEGSRRVDGRAVRRALGVTLRYPTFRDAIRAKIGRCASP